MLTSHAVVQSQHGCNGQLLIKSDPSKDTILCTQFFFFFISA